MMTRLFKPNPPAIHGLQRDLDMLLSQLDTSGVRAALKFLNARVAHRFTAVYKFHGDMLHAVFIYDKLNKPSTGLNALTSAGSFSRFLTPTSPFCVTDSATDERFAEHKHRGVIASYYGVLLPSGSLCHFDYAPQAMPAPEECIFLNHARHLLLTRLKGFRWS